MPRSDVVDAAEEEVVLGLRETPEITAPERVSVNSNSNRRFRLDRVAVMFGRERKRGKMPISLLTDRLHKTTRIEGIGTDQD